MRYAFRALRASCRSSRRFDCNPIVGPWLNHSAITRKGRGTTANSNVVGGRPRDRAADCSLRGGLDQAACSPRILRSLTRGTGRRRLEAALSPFFFVFLYLLLVVQ